MYICIHIGSLGWCVKNKHVAFEVNTARENAKGAMMVDIRYNSLEIFFINKNPFFGFVS